MLKHLELVGTFSILTMLWLIASADEVPLFEGCGGKHWKGSTTCVTGACCVEISIYHSMCLPDDPEHPKCRPIPPPPVAPLYGQCGGIGWTGPTTCAQDVTCKQLTAYFSQCHP